MNYGGNEITEQEKDGVAKLKNGFVKNGEIIQIKFS